VKFCCSPVVSKHSCNHLIENRAPSATAKPALLNGCSFIRWELFAIENGGHSHQSFTKTRQYQGTVFNSRGQQGRKQEFFKRGAEILRSILLSLKHRLPYLLKRLCHMCYFNFNTSTLSLTRSNHDVCFSLPVFPVTVILLIC